MTSAETPRKRPAGARTQTERSADMKKRLVAAAIESLIDFGYAHTTSVEVCRRAGVTRGALNHHFSSTSALLIGVLEELYSQLSKRGPEPEAETLEALIRLGWHRFKQREYKAVIEIWLASRNDPDLAEEIAPAIARLSLLFVPAQNPALVELLGQDPERRALYHLAVEAMIGLALGRATSPGGRPVKHEPEVIDLLATLAREREKST
jgi:AcrR family transcriptional regulator